MSVERSSDLFVRVATRAYALSLLHVVEVMPCLPMEPLDKMPVFVLGIATIRGVPTPVVDLGLLTGVPAASREGRFVSLRIGTRFVALAVDAVLAVRDLAAERHALPPLVGEGNAERIEALASLDPELLLVMNTARLLPESFWDAMPALEAVS